MTTKVFTLRWTRGSGHRILVKVIDEKGRIFVLRKNYPDWFAVSTPNIDEFMSCVCKKFDRRATFVPLSGEYKSTFPLFRDRIDVGNFDYAGFPFYRIYLPPSINVKEVGLFFQETYGANYFQQWRTRLYLDLREKLGRFDYYGWYSVDLDETDLEKSFVQIFEEDTPLPPLRVLSFDLETAPMEKGSSRFPNGFHYNDFIVMISFVSSSSSAQVFYLLPRADMLPPTSPNNSVRYTAFTSEICMILTFLRVLKDPSLVILTGYNILSFDLPCLVARLTLYAHNGHPEAQAFLDSHVSSKAIGQHVVPTFYKKMVIDMYHYVMAFSSQNLVNFKLDTVCEAKLGSKKVPISPVSIHKWYQARDFLPGPALTEENLDSAYQLVVVAGPLKKSAFGTFLDCLHYSYRDSELVFRLFRKEEASSFLIQRSNVCGISMEESLYCGSASYIENVLSTYGTIQGFFVHLEKFRNVDRDGDGCLFLDHAAAGKSKKYQGALNFSRELSFHENVCCIDFESLYPSVIMCFNLSPETQTVVSLDTYRSLPRRVRDACKATRFRVHGEQDFFRRQEEDSEGKLIILRYEKERGFVPALLYRLREERRKYKRLMKTSSQQKYAYYYNQQLMFKLLLNSIYGVFGSSNSLLSNISIAMVVTFYARVCLLRAYHYVCGLSYTVAYADTDSLFVVDCDDEFLCQKINQFLGHTEYINMEKEAQYRSMIVLTKKKYIVEYFNRKTLMKGGEKKSNDLAKRMLQRAISECLAALKQGGGEDESRGWVLLQELLQNAFTESSRESYFVNRKVKPVDEYSPRTTAPHVRLLRRNNFFHKTSIQYAYIFTDVSAEYDRLENPRLPEECHDSVINFEQLFIAQKKNVLTLLRIAFFPSRSEKYMNAKCNEMIQTMRWKMITHAALQCKRKFGEDLLVCFRKDLKYKLQYKTVV